MNLENILKRIQAKLDISYDDIEWDDDETLARIELANNAIETWAKADNVKWSELFTIFSTPNIEVGENEFTLEDFAGLESVNFPNGSLLEIKNIRNAKSAGDYGFIEGNASSGYKLIIGKSITENDSLFNKSLRVSYYRTPQPLEKPEDIPEMSDPSFIVDYVCAAVASDDDMNKFSIFSTDYVNKLSNMINKNYQISTGENDDVYTENDLIIGE